ncbi:unnamed protein product [Rotaria magnacalcarata]|uniref:Uncharacterized protein n=1 Tax=Rotaria magnacalcarata TaxID=392030 RepID=A0A820W5M0_9BILA|nr:unnamed protein product [Rotaria magnacalcarata]
MPDLFNKWTCASIMFLYYKLSDTVNYNSNGDPSGINNSTNDIHSYTSQRPQQNNYLVSSHQNRNPEHHEQYNTHHSNTSHKPATRPSKKRKQVC